MQSTSLASIETKMAAAEGKKRSENFSKEETFFLCEEMEKRIDIIRSKQTKNIVELL